MISAYSGGANNYSLETPPRDHAAQQLESQTATVEVVEEEPQLAESGGASGDLGQMMLAETNLGEFCVFDPDTASMFATNAFFSEIVLSK